MACVRERRWIRKNERLRGKKGVKIRQKNIFIKRKKSMEGRRNLRQFPGPQAKCLRKEPAEDVSKPWLQIAFLGLAPLSVITCVLAAWQASNKVWLFVFPPLVECNFFAIIVGRVRKSSFILSLLFIIFSYFSSLNICYLYVLVFYF